MDLDLEQTIFQTRASLAKIEEKLGNFALLQQQLAIMERQLDSIVVLASRSFVGTLDPAAKEAAMKETKELADKLAEEAEKKMEELINARGGDHPPTPEEIAAAEREFA